MQIPWYMNMVIMEYPTDERETSNDTVVIKWEKIISLWETDRLLTRFTFKKLFFSLNKLNNHVTF